MKLKKILVLALGIFAATSVATYAKTMEFTIGSESVYVSDEKISDEKLEAAPYTENERTMVPVRVISEQFGCDVFWDNVVRQVVIVSGDKVITLTIDSEIADVNGEKITLDSPAVIKNDNTMVPLRFVSEALGKDVQYVGLTNQVLISDMLPVLELGEEKISYEQLEMFLLSAMRDESVLSDRDLFAEYMSSCVSALESDIVAESALKKNNHIIDGEYKTGLLNYISESKETIYAEGFLCADYAHLLEKEYYINAYANSFADEISDESVNEYYNENYVRAKHILVGDEKTASEVLNKLKKGGDFDKLTDEYGTDPGVATNPDGYTFTYGEMVEEFERAAFGLDIGKVSDIVKTDFGYHIIKREKLLPIEEIPGGFESVGNEVLYKVVDDKLTAEKKTAGVVCNYTPAQLVDIFAERFELEF